MNKTEELICIFGALCDHMVDNGGCDESCPYAETKDTIYGKEMPFEGPKDISANLEEEVHTYDTGTETQER